MDTQAIALPPEVTKLTPKQQRFVVEYQRTGNASEAYRVSYDAEGMSVGSLATEASRLLRNPQLAPIVASQVEQAIAVAQSLAQKSIERLDTLADTPEDATASRLAVSERANARLLEAAGVLKTGQGVTVNVDARNVDAGAVGNWNEQGPDGLTGAERFRASQARVVEPETGT